MSEEEAWEALSALHALHLRGESEERDGGKDARRACRATPRKAIDMSKRSPAKRSLAVSSGKRVRKRPPPASGPHGNVRCDRRERCDLGRALSVSLGETFCSSRYR